jgi:NAD(P) transhydrogenase subunit alpha
VVEASDIREDAQEQARSLGATVIAADLGEEGEGEGGYARSLSEAAQRKQRELLAERIRHADALITTALVPGRPAPRIVTAEIVGRMKPGSVVIDLAAEAGGNVEGVEAGRTVTRHGVVLVGPVNLPAAMPTDSSRMYARNLEEVVRHLTPASAAGDALARVAVRIDLTDEITASAIAVHDGEVRHALTRERLGLSPAGSAP